MLSSTFYSQAYQVGGEFIAFQNTTQKMDLVATLQSVVECPICCLHRDVKLFVCLNGHLICEPCLDKIREECPQVKQL